jgi:hypothetical protein
MLNEEQLKEMQNNARSLYDKKYAVRSKLWLEARLEDVERSLSIGRKFLLDLISDVRRYQEENACDEAEIEVIKKLRKEQEQPSQEEVDKKIHETYKRIEPHYSEANRKLANPND